MKKFLLLFVAIVFIANAGFSQVKFGVTAGGNFAGFQVGESYLRNGIAAGVFARMNVLKNEKLVFQPELLYTNQGVYFKDYFSYYEYNVGSTGYLFKYHYKLDYVYLPLTFKYYLVHGFNVQVAPKIGYLLSAKYDGKYKSGTGTTLAEYDYTSASEDIKEYVDNIDYGVDMGIGYDFNFGLGLDVRYYCGLAKVMDNRDALWGGLGLDPAGHESNKWRNGAFQVKVAWTFGSKKNKVPKVDQPAE